MNLKGRALLFTSIAHFLNDSFLVTLSILLTYYIDMKVPALFVGAMIALVNLLSGLASPLVSNWADRTGRHSLLMYIGFIMIGLSLASFSGSFVTRGVPQLAYIGLGSVLLGLGLAFYHPLGGAILQYTYEGSAGGALGINGALGSVGRALAPTMLVLLIGYLGGSAALAIVSAYVLVLASIVYAGLRPIRMPATRETAARSFSRLSSYAYMLVPLTAMIFIRAMFITGVMSYTPTYIDGLTKSKELMGFIVTGAYATAVVGQPFFGWMVNRYGGRFVVVLTTVASTLLYVPFLLVKSAVLLGVTLGLYSFFAFSGFPVLLGYVSQFVDPSARAQANSIVWGIGNTVGGAVGALVGGYIMSQGSLFGLRGVGATMWVLLIFAVVSTAMLPLLPARARQARQP